MYEGGWREQDIDRSTMCNDAQKDQSAEWNDTNLMQRGQCVR